MSNRKQDFDLFARASGLVPIPRLFVCVLCFVFCVLCFVFCVLCFVFCVLCCVLCCGLCCGLCWLSLCCVSRAPEKF